LTLLLSWISSVAQQAQTKAHPLTFRYGYSINPGKRDELIDLAKTVGQLVRDKLMAEGIVLAWEVQASLMSVPGGGTHWVWYAVSGWSGMEKVDRAMRARIAKVSSSEPTAAAAKKDK
jgi:hypothetical protein